MQIINFTKRALIFSSLLNGRNVMHYACVVHTIEKNACVALFVFIYLS